MAEAKLKVKLLRHTKDPEKTISMAARQCYSDIGVADLEKKLTDKEVISLLNYLIRSGHHSAIEHASFTFGVQGISRACSHQLVRHRLASFSQQSQRYVGLVEPSYIIPPIIKSNKKLKKIFEDSIKRSWDSYSKLVDSLVKSGRDKKLGLEDARFLLPNACETKIVITMNARELLHFFKMRLCNRAQWEIKNMAQLMLEECLKVASNIFKHAGPTCETESICWEGKMTCGKKINSKKNKIEIRERS